MDLVKNPTPQITARTESPFDQSAHYYDRDFSDRTLGRWLREATWDYLEEAFSPEDRLLDLGCGTGRDAIMLAGRGNRVTAVDLSEHMLAVAERTAEKAGVRGAIDFRQIDLNNLSMGALLPDQNSGPGLPYDGAYSNFGVLNCTPDLHSISHVLHAVVRPGGKLILVLMSPFCAWEIFWFALHGKPRAAVRRFRSGGMADIGGGAKVRVWYPNPWKIRSLFEPSFRTLKTVGLGLLLPPSYLSGMVERHPRLFELFRKVEGRVAGLPVMPSLSDHFLIVLERRADGDD